MRTRTLAVSVIAHAAVVAAILVAPIFATADLPDPRRPLTFEAITPIVTPSIPVAARPQRVQTAAATQSIPLIEPKELSPDSPAAVPDIPPDLVASAGAGVPTNAFGPLGDPVLAPPPAQARKDLVRVGGVIRPPTRVVYVAPLYPSMALAARKEGTVILQAVIDEQGSVRELRSCAVTRYSTMRRCRRSSKWQFTPTLLNGTTVPVVMTVTVTFALTK